MVRTPSVRVAIGRFSKYAGISGGKPREPSTWSRPSSAVSSANPWAPRTGIICSERESVTSLRLSASVSAEVMCSRWNSVPARTGAPAGEACATSTSRSLRGRSSGRMRSVMPRPSAYRTKVSHRPSGLRALKRAGRRLKSADRYAFSFAGSSSQGSTSQGRRPSSSSRPMHSSAQVPASTKVTRPSRSRPHTAPGRRSTTSTAGSAPGDGSGSRASGSGRGRTGSPRAAQALSTRAMRRQAETMTLSSSGPSTGGRVPGHSNSTTPQQVPPSTMGDTYRAAG